MVNPPAVKNRQAQRSDLTQELWQPGDRDLTNNTLTFWYKRSDCGQRVFKNWQ